MFIYSTFNALVLNAFVLLSLADRIKVWFMLTQLNWEEDDETNAEIKGYYSETEGIFMFLQLFPDACVEDLHLLSDKCASECFLRLH